MDYKQLKNKYNTPLYVYDVDLIKEIINKYQQNFHSPKFQTEILYASKARIHRAKSFMFGFFLYKPNTEINWSRTSLT